MIQIETASGNEVFYSVFKKTGNILEPYESWDGEGWFDAKSAKHHIEELKEAFPEFEFVLFRISVEIEE